MNHTQGHSERTMFAPRGAWQSGVSADFFALGYEPFGSLLPGRNFSSDAYRFGFQGQEKDDEIHGATGTSYSYEYRMHDPRIGRFLSIDPLARKFPYWSPYAFSGNQVIATRELEGLEPDKDLNMNVPTGKEALSQMGTATGVTDGRQPDKRSFRTKVIQAELASHMQAVADELYGRTPGASLPNLTESQRQADFKSSANKTTAILMMEFVTGSGPEHRSFDESHPITEEIKWSYTTRRALEEFERRVEVGRVWNGIPEYIDVPTSPDNTDIFHATMAFAEPVVTGQVSSFLRGSMRYSITANGTNLVIRVTDAYTVASGLSRDAGDNVRRDANSQTPMGTTTVEFNFTHQMRAADPRIH